MPSQPSTKTKSQVHRDVVCPGCGCLCDDLTITTNSADIVSLQPSCDLANEWFGQATARAKSAASIKGQASTDEEAIAEAALLLKNSRSPLIYGLSRSSTEGQRKALDLAEHLRATIDTTASVCHGPSIMAIQEVGESTSTLGEVRDRSDLILFWGADPETTHPRHGERYSLFPKGRWVPNGRSDRRVITIDSAPTKTSELSDQFIQLDREEQFELIWALRQRLIDPDLRCPPLKGIDPRVFEQLYQDLIGCRYGAVFFGLNLAQAKLGHANVQALLSLVAELNKVTRFVARRLRIPGDVTGADSVLCWRTGFPFAVNLALDYPRYNPNEYSANRLLERREVDCAVLVGSESVHLLSESAQDYLQTIPTIVLDYPSTETSFTPSVRFESGIYGIHYEGTAYRMDEVPLPMRQLLPPSLPDDAQWLDRIITAYLSSSKPE